MRERRMFAKTIIMSDAFLDMPASTRCLYFTLAMFADDDGFVNNPKSILRQCGCSNDDMNILLSKKFVLMFEDGVIVIKHWRIHNYIRGDRYIQTNYENHKQELELDENEAYRFKSKTTLCQPSGIPSDNQVVTKCQPSGIPSDNQVVTKCQPSGIPSDNQVVDNWYTEDNISKYNINNNYICDTKNEKVNKNKFIKPTIDEINEYCKQKSYNIDAEYFWNFYESKGWMVGKNKMKSWKSALNLWNKNNTSKDNVKFVPSVKRQVPVPDWYEEYEKELQEKREQEEIENAKNQDVSIEELQEMAKGLFD